MVMHKRIRIIDVVIETSPFFAFPASGLTGAVLIGKQCLLAIAQHCHLLPQSSSLKAPPSKLLPQSSSLKVAETLDEQT
jgi:hypothetical protein